MESGRFVAPITTTCPRPSMPSMSARSVLTMLAWIWSCLLERTGAKPSISSKKMMLGCAFFASSNSRRSWRSASPTHLDRQSAPLRIKKLIVCPDVEQLAASARAISVLPVPGGPWKSTPRGGDTPNCWNSSGYSSGRLTISLSCCTCDSRPPTCVKSICMSTPSGSTSASGSPSRRTRPMGSVAVLWPPGAGAGPFSSSAPPPAPPPSRAALSVCRGSSSELSSTSSPNAAA